MGAELAGQMKDEKLHAVVARSTFRSENAQNTSGSDHFWQLRCRKSARRCGAKHISKSKCTKHTRSGPLLAVEMSKKCTLLWREAHFQVKMYKHTRSGPLLEVEMLKKCTLLWSQNVQNTPCSDHFWRFGCRKSARRCGAKDIWKSKCTKHTRSGPLLAVEMSKKCKPLWREAHFEVKMYKTPHVRATFGGSDVEKVHAVVARSTFRSQNAQNTPASDHFWKLRCRTSARRCGVKMYKTLGVRTTFGGSDVASLQDTTLQDITLHYTPVHYITLHYTPVHSTTLNYTSPHYIALNDTATQIDR